VAIAVLVISTAVAALGVLIAIAPPGTVHRPRRKWLRSGLRWQITIAVLTAALVFVVSGWIVPAVVLGAGACWAAAGWQRRQRHGQAEIERIEALASWIENLRDVLIAGDQPIGAIAATVATCPPVIRPHVRRLVAGLGRQDPDVVFRRFADDIDDPIGDLVATGLMIAVRRGARTVGVLSALADQARQQADRRRLVEAERAPTRREVAMLTTIMGALVVALFVFGRSDYLQAYDEASGQLFLAVAVAGYACLLARVQRLARFPRAGRFLTLERTVP
jgi:tight adherence protein B